MTTYTSTCEPDVDGQWRIVVTSVYTPGWMGRLFGLTPSRRSTAYVGDCTVWYRLPEFRREGTCQEAWLSDIWARERYRRKRGKLERDKPKVLGGWDDEL